jgi:hypothetical protein
MPPAKKTKKAGRADEDDDRDTICVLSERLDVNRLEEVSQLWLDPQTAKTVERLIKKACEDKGWNTAVYKRKKGTKGRVYAGNSLQTLKGWITRIVAGHFYTEIDIHGCAPVLVLHLSAKYGLNLPTIEQYVTDREGLFNRVRLQTPLLQDASDALLKKAFLVGMHGGSYRNFFKENAMRLDVYDCPPLQSWCDECALFASRVKHACDDEDDEVRVDDEKDASLLAKAWQALEIKILFVLKDFFTGVGFKVGVLKHDAILVEHQGDKAFEPTLLQQAVDFVRVVHDVNHLRLVEKKLTPTPADWELFYGPKRLDAIRFPLDKVVHLVTFAAKKAGYKRMGEDVYSTHAFIPCVWAPLKPIVDYANEVAVANHYSTPPLKQFMEWAMTVDHVQFPLIKPTDFDNTKIAFVNGYIDIIHGRFSKWDDSNKNSFTTCHFFEKIFDKSRMMPEDTPLWTNIIDTQLAVKNEDGTVDRTACVLLEALIGRMFLPIGTLDNWQVAPALIGDANTGKSSIAKVVTAMFPPSQVGVISSSFEGTFGLMNFKKKRVIICPDMPVNLHKVLVDLF